MSNKKQGEASAGYMLMKPLVDTATAAGVRALYDVRVQSLIVESDGRVVGIRARRYGSEVTIRARRGVVLATGSFAYNDAMVAQYAPRIAGRPAASIEQHDGQAIRMAQALGADLAHMDATEVAIFIDPQQLVRGILVNGRGQRYVAEDTYPGRIGQLTLYHQDNTAYLIIDGDAQDEAMASWSPQFMMRPPTWVCDTVADLEARDGPGARFPAGHRRRLQRRRRARRGPAAAQEARVAQADRLAGRRDRPAREHRRLHARRPAAPRWTGRCCTSVASRFPGSSPRAGRTAGLAAWGYASGVSLGDGSFYGRRAGRSQPRTADSPNSPDRSRTLGVSRGFCVSACVTAATPCGTNSHIPIGICSMRHSGGPMTVTVAARRTPPPAPSSTASRWSSMPSTDRDG